MSNNTALYLDWMGYLSCVIYRGAGQTEPTSLQITKNNITHHPLNSSDLIGAN